MVANAHQNIKNYWILDIEEYSEHGDDEEKWFGWRWELRFLGWRKQGTRNFDWKWEERAKEIWKVSK